MSESPSSDAPDLVSRDLRSPDGLYARPRLVVEHLDNLEALWLRRPAELFSTRISDRRDQLWSRQLRASLRGLALRRSEAIAEASLRLASPYRSRVLAATHVLATVAPELCVGEHGEVLLRTRHPAAVAEALAAAGLPRRPLIGDDVSVEAYSARADVPEGVLIGHLYSANPRAGLIAVCRAATVPDWVHRRLMQLFSSRRAPLLARYRSLAAYAWAVAAGRTRGGADAVTSSIVDLFVGDELVAASKVDRETAMGARAMLLGMAVIGNLATARAVVEQIARSGAEPDLLYALGVLGIPRWSGPLVDALEATDDAIRREALRGLYLMTGRLFIHGDDRNLREDGRALSGDSAAARAFLGSWAHRRSVERIHLGVPLREPMRGAPPSARWLRSVLSGTPRHLAGALMPGLFDGRPRQGGTIFSILPPALFAPKRSPSPRVIDFELRRRGRP